MKQIMYGVSVWVGASIVNFVFEPYSFNGVSLLFCWTLILAFLIKVNYFIDQEKS